MAAGAGIGGGPVAFQGHIEAVVALQPAQPVHLEVALGADRLLDRLVADTPDAGAGDQRLEPGQACLVRVGGQLPMGQGEFRQLIRVPAVLHGIEDLPQRGMALLQQFDHRGVR